MVRRLALLAFAFAFAFAGAGRMEAAASHCLKLGLKLGLKLAAIEAVAADASEPPCHRTADKASHHKAPKPSAPHGDICLCLAVAKSAPGVEETAASAKAEASPWAMPAPVTFVSNELGPERPPPRG